VNFKTTVIVVDNPEGTGDKTLRESGLTLMYPCFGQEDRILKLLEVWDAWSEDVKQHVDIILIDDHGTPSIEDMLVDREMDYNLSVYRILDDINNNMSGAMNLGMMAAVTPWLLSMDTDYTFMPDVMQQLLDFKPHRNEVYHFFLERVPHDERVSKMQRAHTNTFLLHKDTFTALNGFDEDFSCAADAEVQRYGFHENNFIHKFQHGGYQLVEQRGYIATEWKDDPPLRGAGNVPTNTRLGKRMCKAKLRDELPCSTDMLRFNWKKVMQVRRKP
jgi:glycosyltransferase involved in cell wall biosynthesis